MLFNPLVRKNSVFPKLPEHKYYYILLHQLPKSYCEQSDGRNSAIIFVFPIAPSTITSHVRCSINIY